MGLDIGWAKAGTLLLTGNLEGSLVSLSTDWLEEAMIVPERVNVSTGVGSGGTVVSGELFAEPPLPPPPQAVPRTQMTAPASRCNDFLKLYSVLVSCALDSKR